MQLIERVRCGIPECNWMTLFKVSDRWELSTRAVSECYSFFWDHCVQSHGLNPNTAELPGMTEAKFFVDLTEGTLTIDMKPAVDALHKFVAGSGGPSAPPRGIFPPARSV